MKYLNIIIFFFFFSANSLTAQNSIKIYSFQTKSLWGKVDIKVVFWSFYKVDMKNKTIQYQEFETVTEDGFAPDLSQPLNLFKDRTTQTFDVINNEKIKIPRLNNSRKWYDLATPQRGKSTSAEVFYINGETFRERGSKNKHKLDKELTEIFNVAQEAK